MFGQSQYYNYPPNVSYNPYLHSSYQRPSPFDPIPTRAPVDHDRVMQDRARALAEQRARRSQYLPDEDDEDEDNWEYNQLGPRERAYLDAKRRQDMLERQRQQEALERRRALEVQREKALEQKQRELEARQRSLEEQRNQLRFQEEAANRQVAAEHEKRNRQQQQPQSERHRSRSRGPAPQSPATRQEEGSLPINAQQASSQPSAKPTAVPLTSRSATFPPKPAPTIEEQNAAASRIQKRYRIHASSGALDEIASQFDNVKKSFVYPRVIDFKKPGPEDGHVSVPACRPPSDFDNEEESMYVDSPGGKLTYTSTNYGLHQYTDALVKLLMKLDGVESWGDKGLRLKRREVVKDIEKEASKLERYWKQTWADYLAKQAAEDQKTQGESEQEETQ
ncbi:hypothetical protein GALMADRAFT_245541 [Galerina marginata CBS 339.88]|uniref:BAG domain-containing protein n=1 Tax=Galerina marginata (strain CBS 339.88) TaxID=685588 RepID=A0A067T5I3_GALM3|nr:hypothetical protein GALMADRAFT_245541 [Galerina marginata CBS 339.88]